MPMNILHSDQTYFQLHIKVYIGHKGEEAFPDKPGLFMQISVWGGDKGPMGGIGA